MRLAIVSLAFWSAAAHASGSSGKIISAPQIAVQDNNGKTKVINLSSPLSSYELSEERTSVFLRTVEGESTTITKCGTPLGALNAPLTLNVDESGVKKKLTIPARGAYVHQNGGCDESGNPLVLKIVSDAAHLIVLDEPSFANGERINNQFEEESQDIAMSFSEVQNQIAAGNFPAARIAFSKAINQNLLPNEVERLKAIRLEMPENQRPIDPKGHSYSKTLSRIFARDVDAMTLQQYLDFVQNYFLKFRNNEGGNAVSEVSALGLLIEVGASKEDLQTILRTAIHTNFHGMIDFAKQGKSRKDLHLKPQWILAEALAYLDFAMTPEEVATFISALRAELREEMSRDERVANLFHTIYQGYRGHKLTERR